MSFFESFFSKVNIFEANSETESSMISLKENSVFKLLSSELFFDSLEVTFAFVDAFFFLLVYFIFRSLS